jgi:hypothetical protein
VLDCESSKGQISIVQKRDHKRWRGVLPFRCEHCFPTGRVHSLIGALRLALMFNP